MKLCYRLITSEQQVLVCQDIKLVYRVYCNVTKDCITFMSRICLHFRMSTAWKSLYKHSTNYYKLLQINLAALKKRTKVMKLQESELQKVTILIITLQCKLQTLGVECPHKMRRKVTAGDKLSIEGSSTLAIHSWIHLLESAQGTYQHFIEIN